MFGSPSARAHGIAALLVVQVFFGLFPLAVKFTLDGPDVAGGGEGFTPRAIAAWRIGFAGAVLGGLAFARYGRAAWPGWRDLGRLLVCSTLGVALNQVLFLEGMLRTTVVNAGLLITLIPVFTYGLALVVRQERFAASRVAGIGVALFGAVLLNLRKGSAEAHLAGNLMLVGNSLCYAFYLVLVRKVLARRPVLVVIAWVFLLAAWALPVLARGQELAPQPAARPALLGLAYILLFPTVLAYLLNTYALARVSASTTAFFIYLQPLVTGFAGVVVLDEPLGPALFVASALLFTGMFLVTRRPVAKERPAVPEPVETRPRPG